jgi:CDP-paratose 2-epimerase
LHVQDLVELVEDQLARPDHWAGVTVNVGGGRECSLSLMETTAICRELTGNHVPIGSIAENRRGDVPIYLSDCERLSRHTDWTPRRGAREIVEDIFSWVRDNESAVVGAIG